MYDYKANIIRIVDGDTVDAEISLGFHMTATLRLRLLGIDAPEMTGEHKARGREAMAFVVRELLGREVVIHTEKGDSFGRWLAVVYLDGVDFNLKMLAEGHAVPYSR